MINNIWEPVTILADKPEVLTAIQPIEAEELGKLAKGKDVLEIGGATGYSAIIMALAGANHVTSVDPHKADTWLGDTFKIMSENLAAFGVSDKVTIVSEYSEVAMPQMIKEGRKFDFIFVDGGCEYPHTFNDTGWAMELLKPGGIMARHDYDYLPYQCVTWALDARFPQGPTRLVHSLFIIEI